MAVHKTKAATATRHAALGLSDQDVLDMYYYVALARALDDRMWVLQRAGKAMFVISGPGHEGCQVGAMWPMDKKNDWLVPFYRSVAACLVKGMTPKDILLGLFARAVDPSSGGRQMPGHYGHPGVKILSTSSPVGTQYPHAVGIAYAAKLRKTGEVTLSPSRCTNRWPARASPRAPPGTVSREWWRTAATSWSATASRKRPTIGRSAARGRRSSSTAWNAWGRIPATTSRSATGPKRRSRPRAGAIRW